MFIFTKKQLYKKIDKAFDQIKHGTYRRLVVYFEDSMAVDKKDSGLLAAAVTNRLFSLPPVGKEGSEYLLKNKAYIAKVCDSLKGEKDILHAVTLALRLRQKVLFDLMDEGRSSGFAINKPLENLMNMGLMAEVKELMEPKAFLKFARKFLQKSPE